MRDAARQPDRSANGDGAPLLLPVQPDALASLVRRIVEEVFAAVQRDQAALPDGRLAFGESEAARMLGLHTHQLRDCRLRGEIKASVGPGRKILYSREDLLSYLAARRWKPRDG